MKYVQVSKAVYDYEARTEDELTVKENDILYVIEKEDDDWWKAELKQVSGEETGPVGLVPAQYLEQVTPIGRVYAEYDYQSQQEEELSFQEGDEMDLLEKDDPDWYLVKHANGQVGLAPSNYVQPLKGSFTRNDYLPTADEEQEAHMMEPTQPIQPSIPVPPIMNSKGSVPSPTIQPVLSHTTGSIRDNADDAQSWAVHEYDPVKKKKKKGKGNLLIGNGMLCYGSETDKASPVQQYPILEVKKYLFDSKNLHIEINDSIVLDFQASSKSEAKAILVKISDSIRLAQALATHLNSAEPISPEKQVAAPAAAFAPQPSVTTEETKCIPKWGVSVYDFNAEGGDELSVAENEQVYVLDYETDDGWWRVQKIDGEVGLVPSSYIEFEKEDADNSKADNVEEIRRQREQEERDLQQRRIAEEQIREQREREESRRREEMRKEQERRAEEERRREEERKRREEEESRRREEEKRRQEAAKRAEAASRQQEEENRRKSVALSRSVSTSSKSSRQQDLPKPDLTKIRTWTDRSGAFRVEAQFVDFNNGKLRLHKLNGVKIDVPAEKMSPADIEWVSKYGNKQSVVKDDTASKPPPPPSEPVKKFNERWDWFDWLVEIGIPYQAALQYASAFKAERLDDSDISKLTHKQMKTLGLKEDHVQRIQRYIETGQAEEAEDSIAEKQKAQSQIDKDEELARKLQTEFDNDNKNKQPAGRPRPSVSAPKDVHPDLLGLIGNQLTSDSKGKELEKTKNDAFGFSDDAWAPRSGSSPIPAMTPTVISPPPVIQPSIPTGPSPEELRAQEAERKRAAEAEQIQKIKLMSLQRQSEEQQKQLEQLQKLTKQQLELQQQLAMQTGTQQQQQQQQQQMQQIQIQQQQLQSQLGAYPQQQPSFNTGQPTFSQTQPTPAGRLRPTPNNRLSMDPSLGQWQPNQSTGFQPQSQPQPQQPFQTGFQPQSQQPFQTGLQQQQQFQTGFQSSAPSGFQPQQPTQTGFSPQSAAWQSQALQPQMTGFPAGGYQPQASVPTQPLIPAAGQPSFNGIQRASTIGAQPTGRHWNSSTPDNPFGSPSLSPLQAQMTGVHFSTPSPNAFHESPIQSQQPTGYMQPQMTGMPPTHNIFTPQGSMQYGQSAFPAERRW
ncbi:hypothetical protein BY458DRAFT_504776 [Sporodiniella umbellata]|nr:hypothetical protein BY458DRAFT_504776 [Sporodiniella umbellata]